MARHNPFALHTHIYGNAGQAVHNVMTQYGRPPAPPQAPPAPPTPPPVSQQALAGIAGAYQTYQNTLAGIATQESQLSQNLGYNAQGQLDTSNPYSQAALLDQLSRRQKLGAANRYAASGQLYAGSNQNMQNFLTNQYLQQNDALKRKAAAGYAALAQKRQQAKSGYYSTTGQLAGAAADQGFGYGTIPVVT